MTGIRLVSTIYEKLMEAETGTLRKAVCWTSASLRKLRRGMGYKYKVTQSTRIMTSTKSFRTSSGSWKSLRSLDAPNGGRARL